MFSRITSQRVLNMTTGEQRWFDNIKKAFFDNDRAFTEGRASDRGLEELCKAIDTAQKLRRSLRGEDCSNKNNKAKFVEFVNLEVPDPSRGGMEVELTDARDGKVKTYSFAELVYDIRCMIHENENLNAAEAPNYHILLDWENAPRWTSTTNRPPPWTPYGGTIADGRLALNAHFVWGRVREILAKFITGIDSMITLEREGRFSMTIEPPLGSVRPAPRQR